MIRSHPDHAHHTDPEQPVLSIEALSDRDAPASDALELDFATRTRSRQRVQLRSGLGAGLLLPRGTVLRGGDKLQASDGRIIEVVAAPEQLLEARCETLLALARAAYHLGNRHVSVELGSDAHGDWLRIQADHVLEDMLLGLHARVTHLYAPFEPETGAYSHDHGKHGHSHHTHGSGARIHLMADDG